MKRQEIEATLAAAYPVDRERIEGLDIESLEAALLADVDDLGDGWQASAARRSRRRPLSRPLGVGLASAAVAAAVVAIVLLAGGGAERPCALTAPN